LLAEPSTNIIPNPNLIPKPNPNPNLNPIPNHSSIPVATSADPHIRQSAFYHRPSADSLRSMLTTVTKRNRFTLGSFS